MSRLTRRRRIRARAPEKAPRQVANESLLALSRVALDSSSQGICVYDADNRVVLFNRRFVELFNLSADVICPGLTYRQVMEHSAACGNFGPEKVDGLCEERLVQVAA